jgi:hypothetical protein
VEFKMSSEELIKHQKKIAKQRRTFAQARAIIQRGRSAGIPKEFLRIPQNEFEELLDPKFHSTKKFAETVYKRPQVLFEKPFIIIDGGTPASRKKAGFAVLFRMIACDKHGLTEDCGRMSSKFETFVSDGEGRNEMASRMEKEQILYVQEFHPRRFSIHLAHSGNFFDQILGHREDYSKPTIVSFCAPLENGVINSGNAINDDRCGTYLSMLSHADNNKNEKVFRIRVK